MQEKPATIEPWVDGAKPPSKGADALQMRPESGTFVREGATFAGVGVEDVRRIRVPRSGR